MVLSTAARIVQDLICVRVRDRVVQCDRSVRKQIVKRMVFSTIHVSQAHILEKQSRRRTADSTGSPKWVDSKNPLSGFFYVRINVANAEFSYTYSVKCS